MNKPVNKSTADDCVRIRDFGYRTSRQVRMYGEQFDIVSDPFLDGTGIAVEVTTNRQPKKRALQLPTSLLVGLKHFFNKVK